MARELEITLKIASSSSSKEIEGSSIIGGAASGTGSVCLRLSDFIVSSELAAD